MVVTDRPAANGFVRYARKIYNPVGFTRGYNFVLFVIFGGALIGFTLARFQYMDIEGYYCSALKFLDHPDAPGAAPGECYYYNNFTVEKVGIRLHLWFILPAAFLVVFQFIPVIRHKALIVHRLNGYLVILLALLGDIGGLMISRTAFGGTLDTQTGSGVLFVMTVVSLILSYINIKRLQIDQHRAWMLRAWAYFSVIISVRLILKPLSKYVSLAGTYWTVQPCDKLLYIFKNPDAVVNLYPACRSFINGTNPQGVTLAKADLYAPDPVQVTSALGIGFGTCIWLAIIIHVFLVELYLHLTPREAERLRDVSYQRQLEAGYKHPGNGGLTVQRCGDASPYVPSSVAAKHTESRSDEESETASEIKPSQQTRPEAKTIDSSSSSD